MDNAAQGGELKARVRHQFSQLGNVWPEGDRWSTHTQKSIAQLIQESLPPLIRRGDRRVLNVGSHGNSYGIVDCDHFHLDLAVPSLEDVPLSCGADAEHLPYKAESFDLVLCVGSVINYCRPPQLLGEIAHVLRPGGNLLLEFESSQSLEFLFTADFCRDVSLVRTFYGDVLENIYVYSPRYIASVLAVVGLNVISESRFHRLSPLAYRCTRKERFSALFAWCDAAASKVPWLRKYSANVLVIAQKSV